MKRVSWIIPLMLLGCVPTRPVFTGHEVEVLLFPHISRQTQAILDPNTLATIATLDVVPYLEDVGTYWPISATTGSTTSLGVSDLLKLTQASPTIDPSRPMVFRHLRPNRNYRFYGRAYNQSNAQISQDNSSYVDVAVGNNDAPSMQTLPVNLLPVPFAATASITVTGAGRYDYLKATLLQVVGSAQVAVVQTTRKTANLQFSSLQGNTNYRLLVEAYKFGSMAASQSLDFTIGNETAPLPLSTTVSIPYAVSTIAGNGTAGYCDSTGSSAQFDDPIGIAMDSYGNLFVADYDNNKIRKISPTGVVTTFAGSSAGYLDGTGTSAQFRQPVGLAIDPPGNLYVTDFANHRIRKITPAGVVSTLAGNGVTAFQEGNGTAASFWYPYGIAVDTNSNAYVVDHYNNRIRKIDTSGNVTTVAGSGVQGYLDAANASAQFNHPVGIALDESGNFFIADAGRIRKISGGNVSTYVGTGTIGAQDGTGTSASVRTDFLSVDHDGNLYLVEESHRVRVVTPDRVVRTLAGSNAGFQNGTGTSALFNWPSAITLDSDGNLYISDRYNHSIRRAQ